MKLAAIAASLIMLASFAMPATAEPRLAIHAGGYSYHVLTGDESDYNVWHRLAAVEYGGLLAGYFRNSYYRDSFVVAYGKSWRYGAWMASVHAGAVYGYRSCYGDNGDKAVVCPALFPSLYYTRYKVQPGVVVFGEAVAATVRFEF